MNRVNLICFMKQFIISILLLTSSFFTFFFLKNERVKQHNSEIEKHLKKQQADEDSLLSLGKEVNLLKSQLKESTSRLTRERENCHQLQQQHAKELANIKEQTEQQVT